MFTSLLGIAGRVLFKKSGGGLTKTTLTSGAAFDLGGISTGGTVGDGNMREGGGREGGTGGSIGGGLSQNSILIIAGVGVIALLLLRR